jgi:hypothetical protein
VETKPLREALAEMPVGSTLEIHGVLDLDEFQRRLADEAQVLGVSSARPFAATTFKCADRRWTALPSPKERRRRIERDGLHFGSVMLEPAALCS